MKILKLLSVSGAAATLAVALGGYAAYADDLRLDPKTFGAIGAVDERYQSYNVELAEVIGARFWKPYEHMGASDPAKGDIQVGRDPHLFEQRPPTDLNGHRLRALAAALGPAYVLVSGSWANSVYFQNDDAPAAAPPPEGFNGVLTRTQWRGVVEFSKAVDAKILTSFTISSGVRDAAGVWTPSEARPLLDYTHSIGGEVVAAELFNEPNLSSFAGGPKKYSASAFALDSEVFRKFASEAAPAMKIVGPGDASTGSAVIPGAPTSEELSTAEPRPRFDIFSYHFYPAVSQRCAPPSNTTVGTTQAQALDEAWLARTDQVFQAHKSVRDQYAVGAPIWITETAQAACGGSPWAATFTDTFRYLDQMGRLAKQGADVIFHNTLAASEYGLIDQVTLDPRPDYWAALLWRRLMGPVVLDAGLTQPGLHVYAQCLRGSAGGVTLLVINLSDTPRAIDVHASSEVYALSSTSLNSGTVLLNGNPLAVGKDDRIPELQSLRSKRKNVTVMPRSIDFIVLLRAGNPNCR